ncbi:stage V sporulation protein AB [Clostridia bacterium]|nr:stage V sporulation protein AB [Clostridia bacterium]
MPYIMSIFLGLSSGIVISGAVFAFISAIGIVPRLAQKTRTENKILVYENAIMAGGIFGALMMFWDIKLPLGGFGAAASVLWGLAVGVFYGALAMSLAEVLNVIPVLARRLSAAKGVFYLVLGIALGKLIGALLYYIVPDFYRF